MIMCIVHLQGGIEAERRERERLIQQEQKDMQDSILALIRNRWNRRKSRPYFKLISRVQRLAEKGISSMEEHTAEIKRKKIFSFCFNKISLF